MKINTKALTIVAVCLGMAAHAIVIKPTLVSEEEVLFSASLTVNNAGMTPAVNGGHTLESALMATHQYGELFNGSYLSTNPDGFPGDFFNAVPSVDLVYDLSGGGNTAVGSVILWNGEYHAADGNQLRTAEIRVNTEAQGSASFNGPAVTVVLKPVYDGDGDSSNDLGGINSAQFFSLGAQNGRYVQVKLTDNFTGLQGNVINTEADGGDRVTLGEVRFATEITEPVVPPAISSFTATPSIVPFGQWVTLSWDVSNADTLELNQGIGDVTGLSSMQVVVMNAETTYTLTASNSGGSVSESILVTTGSLNDSSLDAPLAGSQGESGSGWFAVGDAVSGVFVNGDGVWNMANTDGDNAAYTRSTGEHSGSAIYQQVDLYRGVTYRLSAGVGISSGSANNDGKFALGFWNPATSGAASLTETAGIISSRGSFSDYFVEYMPVSNETVNVGVENRGYVPGTGADVNEATILFDNIRLTVLSQPIEHIAILSPSSTPGEQKMVLEWDTNAGQSYNIECKTNLTDHAWTTITNVTGTGGRISVATAAFDSKNFYQVVTPTPPTSNLPAPQAKILVEDDWLYQAGEILTRQDAENEITWAREIASRYDGDTAAAAASLLSELTALEQQILALAPNAPEQTLRPLYVSVRELKRDLLFMDPAVDFDSIVFIDNPYPTAHALPENADKQDSVYYLAEWNHQSQQRNGSMAVPGGRLLRLTGLHPGGQIQQLGPTAYQSAGSFLRPDISFDGKRVLFSFKPESDSSYHIYEMNVDGTDLRQLTDSVYDDNDPIYLPDGGIMFASTRGNTTVRCLRYSPSTLLSRCDADGDDIYILSRNNEPDWLPSLLSDGRVVYTRWEYTEKNVMRVNGLWSVNPDGTQVEVVWGNMSVWPDHLASPRQIPGTSKIMFSGVGHHFWHNGSVGIIDPALGREYPDGLVKVTPDVPFSEVGDGPSSPLPIAGGSYHSSGEWGSYKTPYPLSENLFLVSIYRGSISTADKRAVFPGHFDLYLMDTSGNRELIYTGEHNILHAIPVKPRERPPARSSTVSWPGTGDARQPNAPGYFFSADVYEGTDIPRGSAKHLRVIQLDYRVYTPWLQQFDGTGPNRMPLFSGTYNSASSKRILGTVPINEDGSFMMEIPSGVSLMLQVLDEDYRCIQTMRSFTGVMPGETRGCVGCHERRPTAPANTNPMQMTPSTLTPPPWGTSNFDYEQMIQPIFDAHCLDCHGNVNSVARQKLDLRFVPRASGEDFSSVYLNLLGSGRYYHGLQTWLKNYTGAIDIAMGQQAWTDQSYSLPFEPMTFFSYNSPLLDEITKDPNNHHGSVNLSADELRMLTAWMDLNSPYRGDDELRQLPDPDFPGIEHIVPRPLIRSQPDVPRP